MRKAIDKAFNLMTNWMKNMVFAIAAILVMFGMFAFSTLMFWLKIQAANFMFG